ncbi:MAG: Inosose isomerase [candidate division BRC1 bacterium ADurb.BinA364]|nr:MAG: Inosose isomerase [candidate division BRC1 bacterium ADurb.BinA364]
MTLGRLSEAAALALECGRDNPKLLLDSYHLYKGGSPFEGVSLLRGECLPVFHINDWPAQPPREAIDDKQRVYPGDGVAPLGELYRRLAAVGFDGWLSLELFNESYWKSAPLETAREGLEKTRMTVERAFE